ncbi:MAG: anthranilate synthase component I family protein [Bacteroidales bacterium]
MRDFVEFYIDDFQRLLNGILEWGQGFNHFVLLNSNQDKCPGQLHQKYDLLAGAGSIKVCRTDSGENFARFKEFNQNHNDWIFGYLSYDLKNEIEILESQNFDGIGFNQMLFFIPEYVFILKHKKLRIEYFTGISNNLRIEEIFDKIYAASIGAISNPLKNIDLKQRISYNEYIDIVSEIIGQIKKGNLYEMNLCQEFYIEDVMVSPVDVYIQLNLISPAPYSCFLKENSRFLISSSPERFLLRNAGRIYSQPIKGTAPRGNDAESDLALKLKLENNEKERAENIMIVDLVRNDLSKTAETGTVRVDELCKIYSFRQVHQMVSTISSSPNDKDYDLTDIIKSCFPMGSMTGAPKIKAMQFIEFYEKTKRGLFSGSVGYIDPNKDFDFNVIIRSILYNQDNKYLSYIAGSAITHQSNAQLEYEECLLKASGIFKTLFRD